MRGVSDQKKSLEAKLSALHHQNITFGGRTIQAFRLYYDHWKTLIKERVKAYKDVADVRRSSEMLSKERILEFHARIMTTVGFAIQSLQAHINRDHSASGTIGQLPPPGRFTDLHQQLLVIVNDELRVLEAAGRVESLSSRERAVPAKAASQSGFEPATTSNKERSGVNVYQEYPKCKYHWNGKTATVKDADEEVALGGGWADSPAAFSRYKGPRTAGAEHNPERWADEWPMSGLSSEHRKRIKAHLWRADSEYWKSPDTPSADSAAMRLAFDGVANILFSAGLLTEDLLRDQIPLFVWDSAIAAGWWRLASETPQDMFREQLGHYWVWREVDKDWHGLFRSETGKWRAQLLERPPVPREASRPNFELYGDNVVSKAGHSKPTGNLPFKELVHSADQLPESSEQASLSLAASAPSVEFLDDFASGAARISAIAAYVERWVCSEAALARTAIVDPGDLSKWKKGSLPAGSGKKARIENALRNDKRPIPVSNRPKLS